LCAANRQAIDDQLLVAHLRHRDRERHDPGVSIALDEVGDPWLRDLMLTQELEEVEAEMRKVQIYPSHGLMQPLSAGALDLPREVIDERLRDVGRVVEVLGERALRRGVAA